LRSAQRQTTSGAGPERVEPAGGAAGETVRAHRSPCFHWVSLYRYQSVRPVDLSTVTARCSNRLPREMPT
jgi:hypothetical protein